MWNTNRLNTWARHAALLGSAAAALYTSALWAAGPLGTLPETTPPLGVIQAGKPMVMLGARLYAVGDKVPGGTITRIEETAVWLREAGVVRKVGLFEAVERRTSQASSPTTSASSSKKSVPSKKMRQTHAK